MRLVLRNPFYKRNNFKNLFSRYCRLWGNKYFEFEILRDNYYLFESEFRFTTRRDHAGIKIIFGTFGYSLSGTIYDSRHWDVEKDCWAG